MNERSPGTAEAPNRKRKKSMQRGLTDTDVVYVEPTTTLNDDDLLIEENMTHCDNSVKDIRNEGWSGDYEKFNLLRSQSQLKSATSTQYNSTLLCVHNDIFNQLNFTASLIFLNALHNSLLSKCEENLKQNVLVMLGL